MKQTMEGIIRILVFTLVLFCAGLPASAAISFVQKNIGDNSGISSTSLSVSFSSPTAARDLIVVYVVPANSRPGPILVSDTVANTYYPAASTLTTGQCSMAEILSCRAIVGGTDNKE